MNPIIYFDELDKISDTPKGEEIIGILTHLTDSTQNDKFHDKYFSEIDFDLSKCLFIFSYNDESKINPILIDRMYRIQTNGYSCKEKIQIVKDYLLPKIKSDVKLDEEIIFTDEVIGFIIDRYTGQEKGVRNLKRCIEIIYRKLNLFKLMKPGAKLFDNNSCIKVEFPLTMTNDLVDKLVKKQEEDNVYHHSLYI
jgi:ATP-dependent Lon protease